MRFAHQPQSIVVRGAHSTINQQTASWQGAGDDMAVFDYSGAVDPATEFSAEAVAVSALACIRPNSSRA